MSNPKFNEQRGEIFELQQDLNDLNFEKKREAIKKVIAYMTVGKDVSTLFQPVIKCLEFNDIEMKKLIYLYIVNYSRQKPDDAIMVIQNFRKDVRKSENPLVRALAIRSFGCLRVSKLNDYLIEPLKDCLNDDDPYVRKTAVLCVAKVNEVSPDICKPLVDLLQKLLIKESNALVLANLVQTLKEIGDQQGVNLVTLNGALIQKLLLAVDECMEWGQIFILDYLVTYDPTDSKQAEIIIERTLPRLSHINPTVTFCACKLILKYLDFLDNGDLVKNLCKKISPSLVSLLSWNQPELQYVVLRNISLIIQKFPILFENEVKVFFCSFNEPYYVKYEKLDIMVRICDSRNFVQVLTELHIYINEADPDFVRKTVSSIGKIAIQYDKAVERALGILVEFARNAQSIASEPVQELLIQMQLIYRRYRQVYKHEDSLKCVVSLMDQANEPESKAACAWILGEFAEYIPNVIEKMSDQIQSFQQEERIVQLQILTSCVKLFLKYPGQCESLIMNLLQSATTSFNPDVRDRAYIYWRILSTDPKMAQQLVCQSQQSTIAKDITLWDTKDLVLALENLGSISNLMHKLPHQIYATVHAQQTKEKEVKIYKADPKETKVEQREIITDLIDLGFDQPPQIQATQIQQPQQQQAQGPKQVESFDLI